MNSTHGPLARSVQRGMTLVELMIALLLSMLIVLATLFAQRMLVQQNTRQADNGLRDSETRAAMDLVVHDLSGAGFLFGGSQIACNSIFTYDAQGGGNYARLPVDAFAAASGLQMPFAQNLQLNYPPVGSPIPSDMLVLTGATGTDNFNDVTYPPVNVSPSAVVDPMTTPVLPVVGSAGFAAGDVGILTVPSNNQTACIRFPITLVNPVAGGATISSAGNTMPPASYAGFAPLMASTGFSGQLTKAGIFQGKMVDLGSPATPTQFTTAFYVDGTTAAWPTLMRATFSLLDDSQVGAAQPIAAGVVSFQVLFGVDPANTGAVTAYETGAQMRANLHQNVIRSARIALVTRSLYADNSFSNAAASVVVGGGFANVPIQASDLHHRFSVQRAEIAVRNCLWLNC